MKWDDNSIVYKLKEVINVINHFPTYKELGLVNKKDLSGAIQRRGGINKFRKLLGYEIIKHEVGYWTDEKIIEELNLIIKTIGYFPTQNKLQSLNRQELIGAISRHGGMNRFRSLMKIELPQRVRGYWTDKTIISELEPLIKIIGNFPNEMEFKKHKKNYLLRAIERNGGVIKFKILLGIKIDKVSKGYYNDETIVKEITPIYDRLGRFPTHNELMLMNRSGLSFAIESHGGYPKFKEMFGYTISMHEKYRSKLMSYIQKRGKISEKIVKQILIEYCHLHNILEPTYNVKFANGKIIEFVCNTSKRIGVDVTNTRRKQQISHKWRHKKYHEHLDELWIIVFSDSFTEENYILWNNESPDNVKIMSINTFLKELEYSLDSHTKNKINKYCSCTFHTKDELKNNQFTKLPELASDDEMNLFL